jgi:hypothetical protein
VKVTVWKQSAFHFFNGLIFLRHHFRLLPIWQIANLKSRPRFPTDGCMVGYVDLVPRGTHLSDDRTRAEAY